MEARPAPNDASAAAFGVSWNVKVTTYGDVTIGPPSSAIVGSGACCASVKVPLTAAHGPVSTGPASLASTAVLLSGTVEASLAGPIASAVMLLSEAPAPESAGEAGLFEEPPHAAATRAGAIGRMRRRRR